MTALRLVHQEPTVGVCCDPLRRGCRADLTSDPDWERIGPWTLCDTCDRALTEAWGGRPLTLVDRVRLAGVPRRCVGWSWTGAEIPPGQVIGKLRGWRGRPVTCYLYGDVGAGKTGAAVCIVREWLEEQRVARYLDARDWLERLRYAPDQETSRLDVFGEVAGYPGLVVVDELQTERVTPESYQAVEVTRLVDQRQREELPLLIVGNHPLDGEGDSVAARYGARLASRLSDGLVFEWRGRDRRGRTEWAQ